MSNNKEINRLIAALNRMRNDGWKGLMNKSIEAQEWADQDYNKLLAHLEDQLEEEEGIPFSDVKVGDKFRFVRPLNFNTTTVYRAVREAMSNEPTHLVVDSVGIIYPILDRWNEVGRVEIVHD